MELYILRHGEAGKRIPSGSKDSERPLTVAGLEEVEEVARALARLDVKFDFVATSPLKRARQTADAVAKVLKVKKGSVEEWGELRPARSVPQAVAVQARVVGTCGWPRALPEHDGKRDRL